MIDLNNDQQIDKLRNAAISPNGKLILDFFRQQLEEVSFESIAVNQSDELVGQDFKKVEGIRRFIIHILNLLTPETGD